MMLEKDLSSVRIYCPNCGTLNIGQLLENGEHHFRCENCRVMMIRSHHSRRHNTIQLIVPKGKKQEEE